MKKKKQKSIQNVKIKSFKNNEENENFWERDFGADKILVSSWMIENDMFNPKLEKYDHLKMERSVVKQKLHKNNSLFGFKIHQDSEGKTKFQMKNKKS